jgi:predicted GIY-YIG superfamily endonuclease
VKLAAYWVFDNKSEALKTEIKIKKLSRDQKIKLINEKNIKGNTTSVTLY